MTHKLGRVVVALVLFAQPGLAAAVEFTEGGLPELPVTPIVGESAPTVPQPPQPVVLPSDIETNAAMPAELSANVAEAAAPNQAALPAQSQLTRTASALAAPQARGERASGAEHSVGFVASQELFDGRPMTAVGAAADVPGAAAAPVSPLNSLVEHEAATRASALRWAENSNAGAIHLQSVSVDLHAEKPKFAFSYYSPSTGKAVTYGRPAPVGISLVENGGVLTRGTLSPEALANVDLAATVAKFRAQNRGFKPARVEIQPAPGSKIPAVVFYNARGRSRSVPATTLVPVSAPVDTERLLAAALQLYKAAKWTTSSLSPKAQQELWETFRDASGIPRGTATQLGFAAESVEAAPVAPAVVDPVALVQAPLPPAVDSGPSDPRDAGVKTGRLEDKTFVIFDLETTGLHPEVDKPIQIGAVKFRVKSDGAIDILAKYEQLVDPGAPVPANITMMTNITDGDLRGQPKIEQVLPKFREFIGDDAVLLGHNAKFDTAFLGVQMKEHGLAPLPHLVLDTKELAKNLFPDLLDRRLAKLIALWNLGSVEDHTGLSDSIHTAEVFARELQELAQLKKTSVGALTVQDVAEQSPQLHFDTILKSLEGLPVEGQARAPYPGVEQDVQDKGLKLFWRRQPSQLRDVAQALGLDYAQLRDLLRENAKKAEISAADAILKETAANSPAALIFSFDSLVERNARQDAYPPVSDDVVAALTKLLQSGRPVGIVASYGLEDDAALRERIPAELREHLYFSRDGAKPLYDAMRADGVKDAPEKWLIVGTHLSVADAFPKTRVLSVGDAAPTAPTPLARHLGIKGSRASVRVMEAAAQPGAKRLAKAAKPAKAADEKPDEGRVVTFDFDWSDVIAAKPRQGFEKGAKKTWQGSAWFTLERALQDPGLAKNVYISGRSVDAIYQDLNELQAAGFIDNIPPRYNLRGRGSQSDVEALKAALDKLQKTPFPAKANKIWSENGKGKALRHLYYVSESDWGNYIALRKALGAAIRTKPKRWSNVKIALHYTGGQRETADTDVTFDSKGVVRNLEFRELSEPFDPRVDPTKKISWLEQSKTLPLATEWRSSVASITDVIKKMFVSHSYGNADPGVVDGDDLVVRERQAVVDYINNQKIPNNRKRIILSRYHAEDQELAHALVGALKAGIRVDFITDFNSSMEFNFKNKWEHTLTDFSKAKTKDDPLGQFLQILLDGGFEIVGNNSKKQPRGAVYSQPMYNQKSPKYKKMIPIMHEKSLLLVKEPAPRTKGKAEVVSYYFGTNNLSNHPRYNRLLSLDEQTTMAYALEHSEKLMQGFRAGQTKIEPERPHRVWFEDGSYLEMAYTNGRYNLNGRIVDIFQRARRGELQIENVVFSHFAPTKFNIFTSLKEAMDSQANFRVLSISDNKFTAADSYGKVLTMAGVTTSPPLGGPGFGWKGDLTERVNILAYLRGAKGPDGQDLLETNPNGAPNEREVWHDKTTIIYVNEDGRRWAYIFTGSFNASNHVENAELQFEFRVPVTSHWTKAMEDSIVETVKREKAYFSLGHIDGVRSALAGAAGISPLYVKDSAVNAAIAAAQSKNDTALKSELRDLINEGTAKLKEFFNREEAGRRLKRMLDAMAWYQAQRAAGKIHYPLTVPKLIALGTTVANMDRRIKDTDELRMNKYQLKTQVRNFVWDPTADDAEIERRVAEVWYDVLDISAEMPRREKKWGGAGEDPRKTAEPAPPAFPPRPDAKK